MRGMSAAPHLFKVCLLLVVEYGGRHLLVRPRLPCLKLPRLLRIKLGCRRRLVWRLRLSPLGLRARKDGAACEQRPAELVASCNVKLTCSAAAFNAQGFIQIAMKGRRRRKQKSIVQRSRNECARLTLPLLEALLVAHD